MIRRLLLGSAVLALAGCGATHHPGAVTPGPKAKLESVQAKKIAADEKAKQAVTKTKNVPGRHSGCQNAAAPVFSPDGKRIAFAGGGAICLANADGTSIHAVPGTAVDSAFRLAWVSPRLLLVDDDYQIYGLRPSGKRERLLLKGVDAPSFTVSGDGKRFATGTQSDCPDCVGPARVWSLGGAQIGAIGSGKQYHDAPSLSPDGSKVAYVERGGIWVANADGSGARQLVSGGAAPLWSPRNGAIAYTTSAGLWVVASSGGKPRLVARGADDNAGWSPNGKLIAGWHSGGVEVVDVETGRTRTLPFVGYPDYRASPWSPDSKQLLVTARLTEHCFSLWREPVDGSKPVLLSSCY